MKIIRRGFDFSLHRPSWDDITLKASCVQGHQLDVSVIAYTLSCSMFIASIIKFERRHAAVVAGRTNPMSYVYC